MMDHKTRYYVAALIDYKRINYVQNRSFAIVIVVCSSLFVEDMYNSSNVVEMLVQRLTIVDFVLPNSLNLWPKVGVPARAQKGFKMLVV